MLKFKMVFCLLQSLLMIVSSFSVYDSNFKMFVDRAGLSLTSEKDFGFDRAGAEMFEISEEEKEECRRWFNENILTDKNPGYDFTAGGKSFRKNLSDWEINILPESAQAGKYRNGKTSLISLRNRENALEATVTATIYEDYASCEWYVSIKNTGDVNSPVIKNFYAADCVLDTGISSVCFSQGSDPAADDFELMRSAVSPTPMVFNANGGRSESFLPYFNISGRNRGAVVATGWTGQWYTSLRQTLTGVKIKAKQEFFNTFLEPGEEIRSPLMVVSFYSGSNALKGFNNFRRFEKDCVYPESVRPLNGFVIANEFNTLTCDELIAEVNSIDSAVLDGVDYFWMDAGWYEYNEGWYDGVGNWVPDKKRFPDGIKPLSDAMAAKGKKFLLWFEPERVRENTILYNEGIKHPGWIVQRDDNLLWNLAEDGACDYLAAYISKAMTDNGVTMYRQDFNFTPLEYWRKADRELYGGREGICENRYVTNLYRYLDTLCENVEGLIIDNCASGGKRLDIEMTRRSIPLWRSDYNCGNADGTIKEDVLEATQSMTYGLSCWFVYSGTNRYFHSRYASRTGILTHQSVYDPDPEEFTAYNSISEYMTQNYYPLAYGGADPSKYLAMQFGSEDEGAALIYRREKAARDSFKLVFNGLAREKTYEVYSVDSPADIITETGEALMDSGINLTVSEAPGAVVMLYRVK